MKSRPASSNTVTALLRTAQWTVRDAQCAHAEAMQVHVSTEGRLAAAVQSAEDADQGFREALGNGLLNVATLQNGHLIRTVLHSAVLRCDQEHVSASQSLEHTQHELRIANNGQELYERLLLRRERSQRRLTLHRQQRVADDLGVMRLASQLEQLTEPPKEEQ